MHHPHQPATPPLPQLDGISSAQEQEDSTSVFWLAGLLLERALDADPSLLEEDAPAAAPPAAPAANAVGMVAPASPAEEPAGAPQHAAASAAMAQPAVVLEPTGTRSKYDPLAALLSWATAPAPKRTPAAQRQARYDPVASLHTASAAVAAAAAPVHEHGHRQHQPTPAYSG